MNLTKNQRNLIIGGGIIIGGYIVWRYFLQPKTLAVKSQLPTLDDSLSDNEKIIYIIENSPQVYSEFVVSGNTESKNPVKEVINSISTLNPKELSIVYMAVKSKKENSDISTDEIASSLGISNSEKNLIKEKVRTIIELVNQSKKHPNWVTNWKITKDNLINRYSIVV